MIPPHLQMLLFVRSINHNVSTCQFEAAAAGAVHMWFPFVQYLPGDLFQGQTALTQRGSFRCIHVSIFLSLTQYVYYTFGNLVSHSHREICTFVHTKEQS